MRSRLMRQGIVWGGVLILVGVLLLVETVTDVSSWIWAIVLAGCGLGAFGLYWSDRSDGLMLLAAYVLWAIAGLIAFVPSNILREEAVAIYVLLAIGVPFLVVFIRDRARWWALIPAYAMLAVAGVITLAESGLFSDDLVTAYVLFAIAIPFFVVYARNRRLWWALIPGGILAAVGLTFLVTEAAAVYIGALVLILVGVGVLVRVFTRKEPAEVSGLPNPDVPAATGAESDVRGEGHKE